MKAVPTIIVAVFCAATILIAVFLPIKSYGSEDGRDFTVLTLWHIDMFEGGTGSRASYLKKVCEGFESENDCLITVINETVDDAIKKLSEGNCPDMLSYSVGFEGIYGVAREIEGKPFSGGGEISGKYYASAWAYGGYVIIKRKDSAPTQIIVSKGKYTHPEIACHLNGISLDGATYLLPQRAYEAFISDNNCLLIGTQRDVYRLKKTVDEYEITPIGKYSDLIQYVSVTTADSSKVLLSKAFIDYLTTKGQKSINNLGLASVVKDYNTTDNGLIDRFFAVEYEATASIFASKNVFDSAERKISGEKASDEEKSEFLKNIIKSLK